MKRKLAIVLAAAVAVSALTVSSFADEDYPEVSLIIDGEEVESDQPAVIVSSRTMVPVRVIAEALGCEVNWDAETKTAGFEKDDLSISLTIGETTVSAAVAGVESEVEIDAPAVIINQRTMVPVRFISEFFSADVEWDGETKTVTITSPVVLVADDAESDAAVDAETEETTEADEATEETTEESADEAEETEEDEDSSDEEGEETTAEDSEESDEKSDDESKEVSEEVTAAEAEVTAEMTVVEGDAVSEY